MNKKLDVRCGNEDNFRYLFELQKTGQVNMFGAGQHLQDERGLDRRTAKTVLTYWMTNYSALKADLGI